MAIFLANCYWLVLSLCSNACSAEGTNYKSLCRACEFCGWGLVCLLYDFTPHCICSDTTLLNDHYRAGGVGRFSLLSFIRWAKYSCAPLLVVSIKFSFFSWVLVRVVLCKWIARERLCIRDHRVLRYKNSF